MRNRCYSVARGVFALPLVMILAGSTLAGPNEQGRGLRDAPAKDHPVMKVIRKVVRSLGDALVTPRP